MKPVLTILAMTAAWYGWLGIAYFLRAYHRGGAMDDRHYLAICGAFALLFIVGVGSLIAWLTERRSRIHPPKGVRDSHGTVTVRK